MLLLRWQRMTLIELSDVIAAEHFRYNLIYRTGNNKSNVKIIYKLIALPLDKIIYMAYI